MSSLLIPSSSSFNIVPSFFPFPPPPINFYIRIHTFFLDSLRSINPTFFSISINRFVVSRSQISSTENLSFPRSISVSTVPISRIRIFHRIAQRSKRSNHVPSPLRNFPRPKSSSSIFQPRFRSVEARRTAMPGEEGEDACGVSSVSSPFVVTRGERRWRRRQADSYLGSRFSTTTRTTTRRRRLRRQRRRR